MNLDHLFNIMKLYRTIKEANGQLSGGFVGKPLKLIGRGSTYNDSLVLIEYEDEDCIMQTTIHITWLEPIGFKDYFEA